MKTDLMHAALFTPMAGGYWGLPLMLKGPPGAGKTSSIRAEARAWGFKLKDLSPGRHGEGAFGVTPVPATALDQIVLRYPMPEWALDFMEAGIIFVDEANTAPPALQPALLGLIQDRTIGNHYFAPRVRVMGAMNATGQAAGGWDIAPSVANRIGWIDWPITDVDEWVQGMMTGWAKSDGQVGDALAEEARVMAAWPAAYARATGLVTTFLTRRRELMHRVPEDGSAESQGAFPTGRSWEYTTRALAASEVHNLSEVDANDLQAAFVGQAALTEFSAWASANDLPDPAKLLDGKETFKHAPERLDRSMAVLGSCAALVCPTDSAKREARATALWKIISDVADEAADVTCPAVSSLIGAKLSSMPVARPVLTKHHAVVLAAGGRR